jgi:hypothetical protein
MPRWVEANMSNATKIAMANWTKMVVVGGGTGNITLGAVNGYPPIGEALGVSKSFHYVIRAVNNTPLEAGVGVLTDVITLRRDNVYAKMLNGVYSAGDGLTNLSIPVGAFLYTADTKELLQDLQLEMPLRAYGNIAGATEIDTRHKAITANLTAAATLSFAAGSLPPSGVKHEFSLHITSANAGTASVVKGHLLTLPASCTRGNNACPPIPLPFGRECVIKLSTVDGGVSYKTEVQDFESLVRDLGTVTGSITLDARYANGKAEMALGGSATVAITGIAPNINFDAPAHFTFINTTDGPRSIVFDAEKFDFTNSTLTSFTVPLGYKADFTIRRNPHTLDANYVYDVYANGISYNVTASGLATTWNPSDGAIGTTEPLPFALSEGNTKIERTGVGSGLSNVGKSARAFGGKSAGKWRVSVVLDSAWFSSTSNVAHFAFGVSTAAASLNGWFSDTPTGYALVINTPNSAGTTIVASKENNGTLTTVVAAAAGNLPVNGVVYSVLVDLDANKLWLVKNGVSMSAGNPEAGTGQDFNLIDGAIFFPSIAMSETNTANAGAWKLLNEVSDPYGEIFPSFNYWTA